MDDDHFSTTLAYTKSPKASRRTTFQNELEAAVSARTNRHKPSYSYSDDFDDDEDHDKGDDEDVLSNLLKTQKERKDRFRAGRTKGKISDFMLSDDEDENVKPKKVSFLKTKVSSSPVHIEQQDSMKSVGSYHGSFNFTQSRSTPQSPQNSVTTEKNQEADSPFSSQSDNQSQSTLQKADRSESIMRMRNQTESSLVRKSLSESPLPFNSENSQWKSSVPIPSEGSLCDTPVSLLSDKQDNQKISFGEDCDLPIPHPRERSVKTKLPTGCPAEDMSPRPLPRHKTVNMWDHGPLEEKTQAEPIDCTGRATSTMSVVLSNTSTSNDSVQGSDEGRVMSQNSKTYSSSTTENISEAPATAGSVASEESKEERQSTSFEEKHEGSYGNFGNHTSTSHAQSIRKSSDRKSKSSYTAESKYLGTLKILDQRMQEAQQIPEAADSLRAAVYQEWVKKKEETIKIKMMEKKQEEKLKEDKKQEDMLAKIADAKASYEAWKEQKKDVIRKKEKEKQEEVNRQQMERDKIQEKKEIAKQQVFEKWKQEHDEILKEKIRKKKQTEKREKLQQCRVKEERKRDCTSVFMKWSEQKKCVIQAKVREERKQETFQEVEEQYEKEEREKMALEVYDKWLRRKEFQQKRERKEKRIQAILHDEPPPPWSPPNKTIPFGK